jgi:hypothetical protein
MTQLWAELRDQVMASRRAAHGALWTPPEGFDFRPCRVLVFDPALSNTGWVKFRVSWLGRKAPRFAVEERGTLRVKTDQPGYLGTYDKASRMRGLIQEVVWREQGYHLPYDIAWEAPAVAGRRLESSLIAGFLVYEAANRVGTAVSANHASYQLTGNPSHDKRAIAAAVARYVPESEGRTWNEHQRDALAIGLSFSLDAPEPDPDEADFL